MNSTFQIWFIFVSRNLWNERLKPVVEYKITFWIFVRALWIHKGYFVVKKLVWNVHIKAFWYTNKYSNKIPPNLYFSLYLRVWKYVFFLIFYICVHYLFYKYIYKSWNICTIEGIIRKKNILMWYNNTKRNFRAYVIKIF